MIKFSCVVLKFALSSIVMTFLYTNICIVCDFHKCFDFFIMFSTSRFFFHYLFIIKYNFALCLISKMLVLKRSFFISINIFSIVSFFKFNLHFVFKKFLIFFINVVVIVLILFLFINAIIFFFFIDILIIVDIVFFIKYNTHNNISLLIISINFFCLKYHFDKSLLDSYIRYSLL